jgi:hypothetical protein
MVQTGSGVEIGLDPTEVGSNRTVGGKIKEVFARRRL